MIKIALLSQKGGTGKTTLALNLAVAATLDGKSTAVIDLDPQASMTQWGDSREDDEPFVISAQASRLSHLIEQCKNNDADTVIIDTAPHAEQAALAAARVADAIFIPCKPSIVDIRAIRSSIDICKLANTRPCVVMNQTPWRRNIVDNAIEAIKKLDVDVAPVDVHQRIAYVHAVTSGQGVLEYEPSGKAADEINQLYQFIPQILGRTYEEEKRK